MSKKLMLGGNIFGHFTNKKETEAIIHLSKKLGIFAIDTADVYSNGVSESIIGELIKHDRAKWFIATKAGLASYAPAQGLGRKKSLYEKVKKSLERLQTDYIDLYQMHHFDPETPLEETMEALSELKTKGLIRSIGISNYSLEQLETLTEVSHDISYHQISFNITRPTQARQFLEKSVNQNITLLAYSVLARGLLHEKYLNGAIPIDSRAAVSANVRKDLSENFLAKLKSSYELCVHHGHSLQDIAIQWVLQFRQLKWAIVGVRTPEQLSSIVESASRRIPAETLSQFERIWQSNLNLSK